MTKVWPKRHRQKRWEISELAPIQKKYALLLCHSSYSLDFMLRCPGISRHGAEGVRREKEPGPWLVCPEATVRSKCNIHLLSHSCKVSVTQNRPSSNAQSFPSTPVSHNAGISYHVGLNSSVTSEEHFFATLLIASLSTFYQWRIFCTQHSNMFASHFPVAFSLRVQVPWMEWPCLLHPWLDA